MNKWCAAGVELLASQPLEKYGTIEHAEAGINDIEVFLRTSNDIERLETYLQELTAPESRALILQVKNIYFSIKSVYLTVSLVHLMPTALRTVKKNLDFSYYMIFI